MPFDISPGLTNVRPVHDADQASGTGTRFGVTGALAYTCAIIAH